MRIVGSTFMSYAIELKESELMVILFAIGFLGPAGALSSFLLQEQ
jgi:hypothetical protein